MDTNMNPNNSEIPSVDVPEFIALGSLPSLLVDVAMKLSGSQTKAQKFDI